MDASYPLARDQPASGHRDERAPSVIGQTPCHVYGTISIGENASAVLGNVDQSVHINILTGSGDGSQEQKSNKKRAVEDNVIQHKKRTKTNRAHEISAQIIESLSFNGIWQRHENIVAAYSGTCEWVLTDDCIRTDDQERNHVHHHQEEAKHGFVGWLESTESFYWICGTAGSGKSTLVNFITAHEKDVRHRLGKWATDCDLIIGSFFFYRYGHFLQKSINGMLRTLIVQILQQRPSLAELLVNESSFPYVNSHKEYFISNSHPWTNSSLKELFSTLLRVCDARICFFIDALDEFHGYYGESQLNAHEAALQENTGELLDLIQVTYNNPKVKVCVASRPGNVFNQAFEREADLNLQQLNQHDIERYIHGKMSRKMPDHIADQFTQHLIYKSEGIFLWTKLAVESLLNSFADGDGISDMRKRLVELPIGLEQMYRHMLQKLPTEYKADAALMFSITSYLDAASLKAVPTAVLIFFVRACSERAARQQCEETWKQIADRSYMRKISTARGCGLLELRKATEFSLSSTDAIHRQALPATFLLDLCYVHRTAADFLASNAHEFELFIVKPEDFLPSICTENNKSRMITQAFERGLNMLLQQISKFIRKRIQDVCILGQFVLLDSRLEAQSVAYELYRLALNFLSRTPSSMRDEVWTKLDSLGELCPAEETHSLFCGTIDPKSLTSPVAIRNIRQVQGLPPLIHLALSVDSHPPDYAMARLSPPTTIARTDEIGYLLAFTANYNPNTAWILNRLPLANCLLRNLTDIARGRKYLEGAWKIYLTSLIRWYVGGQLFCACKSKQIALYETALLFMTHNVSQVFRTDWSTIDGSNLHLSRLVTADCLPEDHHYVTNLAKELTSYNHVEVRVNTTIGQIARCEESNAFGPPVETLKVEVHYNASARAIRIYVAPDLEQSAIYFPFPYVGKVWYEMVCTLN